MTDLTREEKVFFLLPHEAHDTVRLIKQRKTAEWNKRKQLCGGKVMGSHEPFRANDTHHSIITTWPSHAQEAINAEDRDPWQNDHEACDG